MTQFSDDALVRITFNTNALVEASRRAGASLDEARVGALRANDTIAHKMAQSQLKFLQDDIESTGRPQRDTQFLIRALESEAYIEYDAHHFTVGTDEVLNDPQISTYWRGLEYGSTSHVGHTLYGYFRSIEGAKYPAMSGRVREDPRLIQLHSSTPPGKRRSKASSRQTFPFPITIHNPIPEYQFLTRGAEAISSEVDQIYRDNIPGLR